MEQMTHQQLLNAIRTVDSLDELKRMIGPSKDEVFAQRSRIAQLDAVSPACKWDEMYPDWQAMEARKKWKQISEACNPFENTYC